MTTTSKQPRVHVIERGLRVARDGVMTLDFEDVFNDVDDLRLIIDDQTPKRFPRPSQTRGG